MSQNKAQVDKYLSGVSNKFIPDGFISEVALPKLAVGQMSGLIGQYMKDHVILENDEMIGKGEARHVETVKPDTAKSFLLTAHGLADTITPEDKINFDDPFDKESDTTEELTGLIWLNKENAFATEVMTAANYHATNKTTLAGANQWSAYSTSSPITDIKAARVAIWDDVKQFANRAIVPSNVAEVLSYHPEVIENLGFKYDKAGALTYEDIQKFMKVQFLHVPNVGYNSAKEGQTASLGSLYSDSVLLYLAPAQAAKKQQSLGYYLTLRGSEGKKVYKSQVDNPPESTQVIVKDVYGFKGVNFDCGYLISDTLA
jgi:hypothetical protein